VDELLAIGDVLSGAQNDLLAGRSAAAETWATGFEPLDTYLSGGLRVGDLTLLGGPQGLGKTTFALQMLRNVVAAGGHGLYLSFEHDARTVLERLLAIEGAERGGDEAPTLRVIREAMKGSAKGGLADQLKRYPGGREAVDAVAELGDRLLIHRSSAATTVEAIGELARSTSHGEPSLIVVDYLQKVPVHISGLVEDERVTMVVEGLKDLALSMPCPVLAVVAADKEGLVAGKRLRIHNLRGSSALAYEADVVLLLNDKYDVVARHHLVYDVANAERFRDYAVLSIDKNRSGVDRIDLEFRKRFEQGRFERTGRPVSEKLVDERVFAE
jgi:replicative DNA helicase